MLAACLGCQAALQAAVAVGWSCLCLLCLQGLACRCCWSCPPALPGMNVCSCIRACMACSHHLLLVACVNSTCLRRLWLPCGLLTLLSHIFVTVAVTLTCNCNSALQGCSVTDIWPHCCAKVLSAEHRPSQQDMDIGAACPWPCAQHCSRLRVVWSGKWHPPSAADV